MNYFHTQAHVRVTVKENKYPKKTPTFTSYRKVIIQSLAANLAILAFEVGLIRPAMRHWGLQI